MKKQLLVIPLVGLFLLLSGCSSDTLTLKGTVETVLLSHYAEINGKLIESPIQLGQTIKAGDIVAVVDDSQEKYALEQLQAGLVKKQAYLAELVNSVDSAEIRRGQNNVTLAEQSIHTLQIDLERATNDYNDAVLLYEQGGISAKALEDAEYKKNMTEEEVVTATTKLDNAQQDLVLISKGAGQEKIAQAQADIVLTTSQIQQGQENLPKYTIRALQDGTVISKNYHQGDVIATGYNLADVAGENEKYILTYLPENYLSQVSHGQQLLIRQNGAEYWGQVTYIDLKAQYTPKEMQTSANKNKESFKLKVALPENTPLKPGETAEVLIPK